MLGGQHPADRELITSWMQRDWADNLYPGAANANGRKLLEEHLDAMLDLETGSPLFTLDGRLIEESQKALARLSVAQRAYEILKSQARTSTANDWTAARKGGPDVTRVFEAAGDPTLESVRVPEFLTYYGFQHDFIGRLGDIKDRIQRDRWVLGDIGQQSALSEQYDNLPDDVLALYTRDFIATWQTELNKLQLRKLTNEKPQYLGLNAISAPTSPLTQLIESIAAETAITREPSAAKPAAGGNSPTLAPTAATPAPSPASAALFKSVNRAPGAEIEAAFKPYQILVEGGSARRPVDDMVATLNEITRGLIAVASEPSQVQRALTSLQDSETKLRNSAERFPKPFSDMLLGLAADLERTVAVSSAGQLQVALRDQVTPVCQATIANRYPFVRSSTSDAPLADFGKLFGAGGVMDTFFRQYLDAYTDRSRPQWRWRQNSEMATTLSPDTLASFQLAAQIRDAYFQTGGNIPFVQLQVKAEPVAAATVKLELGGNVITSPTLPSDGLLGSSATAAPNPPPSPPSTNSPVLVQWPGAALHAAVSVTTSANTAPSVLERSGQWSLFRLLEAGGLSTHGGAASASFSVGGYLLHYDFVSGATQNPLNLALLRSFRCPSGI
jgi:type VI secretion system protein ImpL